MLKKLGIVVSLIFFSGCAILNPYHESFTCGKTPNGKCVSVTAAYNESLGIPPQTNGVSGEVPKPLGNVVPQGVPPLPPAIMPISAAGGYQSLVLARLSELLSEPSPPMLAPAQVLRVLILPYKGRESALFMERYVYLIMDQPKWVFGESNREADMTSPIIP